jgi:RHS repeat-associated protein
MSRVLRLVVSFCPPALAVILFVASPAQVQEKKSGQEKKSETVQPETVQPGERGRAEQERARGLIEGGETPQQDIPVIQEPPGNQTDELIRRLGEQLRQQQQTTPEKPLQTPVPSTPSVATTSAFNGPVVATGQENPTKPACGCSGQGSYNQGISIVVKDCPKGGNKCETVGSYPRLAQDAGPYSVTLSNGEFFHHEVDLEIPGIGFSWKLERRYRSRIVFNGPLGWNWEFGDNRRLHVGADRIVTRMDGSGRTDRYVPGPSGYVSPAGFYTRLTQLPGGGFVERDRTGAHASYGPPDANGMCRITEAADRNGNRLRYTYNAAGQLVRILDTAGRPIAFRYDASGHLIEVEDFAGRRVRYGYDANGNLVSATLPPILGTPNGNDFPEGTTTRYRYTAGSADERLNHKLVEITAPNETAAGGPPRVKVEYDTRPGVPDAGRVLRQTIGGTNASGVAAGGTISYQYTNLGGAVPGDTSTAVFQNTVTDRIGNRTDYQFNQTGNILAIREYARTGRAGDRDFVETRYEYNKDGEMTRMVLPLGNRVDYVYDEGNPDRLQQGNLLSETEWPDPARGGDQKFLRTVYGYEPIFNQLRTVTDPRAFHGDGTPERFTRTMIFDYQEGSSETALAAVTGLAESEVRDLLVRAKVPLRLGDRNGDGRTNQVAGNVVRIVRPGNLVETTAFDSRGRITSVVDEEGVITRYAYAADDPTGGGSLTEVVRNASPRAGGAPSVRTRLTYDAAGNLLRSVNPRGVESRTSYNSRNQPVEIVRANAVVDLLANPIEPKWSRCTADLPECRGGAVAFRQRTRLYYDANGNVVREETVGPDGSTVRSVRHDILDAIVESSSPSSSGSAEAVTRVRYDANGNRILVMSPVASLPASDPAWQAGNVISFAYDERDHLVATARGGDSSSRRYDANGDLVETLDATGRSVQTLLRDGFGRVRSAVDAVGSQILFVLNADDDIASVWQFGSAIGRGASRASASFAPPLAPDTMHQPLLAVSGFTYDDAGRAVTRSERLFEIRGTTPSGPERWLTTAYAFDRRGSLVAMTSPGGSVTKAEYDALGRLVRIVDPEGNESRRTYDANGNLTLEDIAGPANPGTSARRDRRRTYRVYDSLDRPIRITDDGGLTTRFEYDAAGRLVRRSGVAADAQASSFVEDPLGVVRTAGAPPLRINRPGTATTFEYDAGGRVAKESRGASNGAPLSTVETAWDVNGRIVSQTDGAGHRTRFRWDERDRPVEETDGSGRTRSLMFDANDRVTRIILPDGAAVHVERDARGLVVSRVAVPAEKASRWVGTMRQDFEWDGAGRLTRAFDDNQPEDKTDDAETRFVHDSLGRIVEEIQNGRRVATRWDDDGRPVGLAYPGGPDLTIAFDRIGRLREIRDVAAPRPLARYRYSVATGPLERENGNTTRARWFDPARPDASGPDGSGQTRVLRHSDAAGVTFAGGNYEWSGRSRTAAIAPDGARTDWSYDALARLTSERAAGRSTHWKFDGAGNWIEAGGLKNEVDSRNTYTSFGGVPLVSDDAGNLTDDGQRLYEYDFANRLRSVHRKSDGKLVATYTYDALDRRVGRRVEGAGPGGSPERVTYVYDRWNEIQEVRESETRSFVYGKDMDEIVRATRRSADGADLGTHWLHQDANLNVVAVTDAAGKVMQRISYDAYGKPAAVGEATGNAFLFQGRRLDPETGLYYFRLRYYSATFGRFLSRDPLGAWADPRALGNPYAFVGNSPLSFRDPLGLQTTKDKSALSCEWRYVGDTNYNADSKEIGTATITSREHTGLKVQAWLAQVDEAYITFKTELAVTSKVALGMGFANTEVSVKVAIETGVKVAVQTGVKAYYDLLQVEVVTRHHFPMWHVKAKFCKRLIEFKRCFVGQVYTDYREEWYDEGSRTFELFWKDLDVTSYEWEIKKEKVSQTTVKTIPDPNAPAPPASPPAGKKP